MVVKGLIRNAVTRSRQVECLQPAVSENTAGQEAIFMREPVALPVAHDEDFQEHALQDDM